jgi:hypothetical protein
LKLEDLSRVPAETKAAVMQIVEQTKRRSGLIRLAMLGPGAWSIDAYLFGRKKIDFRSVAD